MSLRRSSFRRLKLADYVTSRSRERVGWHRLALALASIALLFVLLLAMDLSEAQARDFESLFSLDAWGQWDQSQRLLSEEVPEGFEEEAFAVKGERELRIEQGACTIGFSCLEDPDQTMDRLRKSLLESGWMEQASGIDGCSAFVKTEGRYRWLFVQCIPVQEWTCVVVNYASQE